MKEISISEEFQKFDGHTKKKEIKIYEKNLRVRCKIRKRSIQMLKFLMEDDK